MTNSILILTCLLLSGLASEPKDPTPQKVEVVISGIRSDEGLIGLALYQDEESFSNEKPLVLNRYPKSNIQNGTMVITLELVPGKYGFALLDDENSNGDMDYNWIGYPLEGFGFSDYWHTGLTRPKLERFSVSIGESESLRVRIKVKYL